MKTYVCLLKAFSAALSLFFLVGCSSTHFKTGIESKPLLGQVIGDHYYAPNNLFSVKVPKSDYIEDSFGEGMTPTVIFRDEIGTLYRIEVLTDDNFLNLQDYEKDKWSSTIYYLVIETHVQTVAPSAKTLLAEQTEHGFLAIMEVPGGSCTLVNLATNQRENAVRAFLIAFQENQVIIISYQDFISSTLPAFTQDLNAQKHYFLQKMHNILVTIKNKNCAVQTDGLGNVDEGL
jgi:hypothetical protein